MLIYALIHSLISPQSLLSSRVSVRLPISNDQQAPQRSKTPHNWREAHALMLTMTLKGYLTFLGRDEYADTVHLPSSPLSSLHATLFSKVTSKARALECPDPPTPDI